MVLVGVYFEGDSTHHGNSIFKIVGLFLIEKKKVLAIVLGDTFKVHLFAIFHEQYLG